MFVNGLAVFTTLGRDIRFGTVEHVPSRTAKQLAKSLLKVVNLYTLGGFVVHNVLMDGEFEKIKPEVELDINISAAKEHVGEIERYHRTLKERCRCVLYDMRPIGSKAYQYLHKPYFQLASCQTKQTYITPLVCGGIAQFRQHVPSQLIY